MADKFRTAFLERVINRSQFYEKIRNYAKIKPRNWKPDITVSREPGSGGRLVAGKVAKKLNWTFLDDKLLQKIAKELNLSEFIADAIDEKPRTKVVDIFHSLFNPNYVSDIAYIRTLKKIVMEAGRDDDVVFLGRGTNHILPSDKALHVYITSTYENRVKNTVKFEHKTYEDARAHVTKVETNRRKFIEQYFGKDAQNPNNFDVIVNTDNISLDQARDIIIEAYKRKFSK